MRLLPSVVRTIRGRYLKHFKSLDTRFAPNDDGSLTQSLPPATERSAVTLRRAPARPSTPTGAERRPSLKEVPQRGIRPQ